MSFQDKSIQRSDCGVTFTFSAEDQEFSRSKGYTNRPNVARNEVSTHKGESQESLLRRFRHMVRMSGTLQEVKAKKNAWRKRRQDYQAKQGTKSGIMEDRL